MDYSTGSCHPYIYTNTNAYNVLGRIIADYWDHHEAPARIFHCSPAIWHSDVRLVKHQSKCIEQIWRFPKIGVPPVIIHFNGIFPFTKTIYFGVPPWRTGKPHTSRGNLTSDASGASPWPAMPPRTQLARSLRIFGSLFDLENRSSDTTWEYAETKCI